MTDRVRATDVLLLSLWFGLLAGLGETALRLVRMFLLHRFLFVSLDSFWTAALADAGLFFVAGLLLIGLRALLPRRVPLPGPVLLFTALTAFTWLLMYGPLWKAAAAIIAVGLGVQAGRIAKRHWTGFTGLALRTLPVLVLLVIVAGAGTRLWLSHSSRWKGPRAASAAGAPNVLLIILDTVRALNLGLYGYSRPTSPELERWARDGTDRL
jgi:hypothetical protein